MSKIKPSRWTKTWHAQTGVRSEETCS